MLHLDDAPSGLTRMGTKVVSRGYNAILFSTFLSLVLVSVVPCAGQDWPNQTIVFEEVTSNEGGKDKLGIKYYVVAAFRYSNARFLHVQDIGSGKCAVVKPYVDFNEERFTITNNSGNARFVSKKTSTLSLSCELAREKPSCIEYEKGIKKSAWKFLGKDWDVDFTKFCKSLVFQDIL